MDLEVSLIRLCSLVIFAYQGLAVEFCLCQLSYLDSYRSDKSCSGSDLDFNPAGPPVPGSRPRACPAPSCPAQTSKRMPLLRTSAQPKCRKQRIRQACFAGATPTLESDLHTSCTLSRHLRCSSYPCKIQNPSHSQTIALRATDGGLINTLRIGWTTNGDAVRTRYVRHCRCPHIRRRCLAFAWIPGIEMWEYSTPHHVPSALGIDS
jgi:hypothetical protein